MKKVVNIFWTSFFVMFVTNLIAIISISTIPAIANSLFLAWLFLLNLFGMFVVLITTIILDFKYVRIPQYEKIIKDSCEKASKEFDEILNDARKELDIKMAEIRKKLNAI